MQAEEDEGKGRGLKAAVTQGSKASCLCQMSSPLKRAPALPKPEMPESKAPMMTEHSKERSKERSTAGSKDIFFKGRSPAKCAKRLARCAALVLAVSSASLLHASSACTCLGQMRAGTGGRLQLVCVSALVFLWAQNFQKHFQLGVPLRSVLKI